VITLKKVSDKKFEKISEIVSGKAIFDLQINDVKKNLVTQDLSNSNANNDLSLEVTGKNVVKIEDSKAGISQEVQAEIDKSILGKIKAIKIDGKTMEALYATSLNESGLDVLKGLNVSSSDGEIKSTITTSDLSCLVNGDLLVCNQTQELNLTLTGN
jgi:hypothetical protein